MTPEALTALKASIEHWEDNVAKAKRKEALLFGVKSCALCNLFHWLFVKEANECKGCPVAAAGHPLCDGSPYDFFEDGRYTEAREQGNWDLITHHAQLELDFLRTLSPQD